VSSQQKKNKKAARMGQKWGKSGGVTEGQIGVLAIVCIFVPTVYERFSMRGFTRTHLSLLITTGYGFFAAGL
jgi:hypothetical protein